MLDMPDPLPSTETPSPTLEFIPPLPPRPSSGPRPRFTPVAVLAIAVAAAVVLSAVFLGGLSGGASGGPSVQSTGPTFSSARVAADQFAAAHGNWSLIDAIGLALYNTSFLPYNGSTGNATCIPVTLAGIVPTNLTLPAFRGDLESGQAPVWLFDYTEPGVGGELAVVEVGGQIPLAIELPPTCTTGPVHYHGVPSPVIDSPAAVAAAAAAGGASFLRAHPTGVSLLMELVAGFSYGNNSSLVSQWGIIWTTCSLAFNSELSTSGYQFSADVNATTGAIVPGSADNTTCGSSVRTPTSGIGGAIAFGAPSLIVGPGTGGTIFSQGCNSGDYCYVEPIVSVSQNLTPADFELAVQNFSNGSTITTIAGFAIVNAAGTVLVYSTGDLETQWSPEAASPQSLLVAGMSIYVDTGPTHPTANNLGLVLTGEGPFADSIMGVSL